ncbi:universal stress protein [Actinoplanes auranticolor]|uniref:Universal stress protein n=1 Tax=Actinoplanes auranticolor TaxID=47988 RepID=A0A919SII7_9ACTN|nr:universal stress protein [Actinoplanes auranticolor]GIM73365.1 universal stress protein [Actinoplanes auranticolor]
MTTSTIAVGTDGTSTSEAAVRWAAAEASRRGVPLRIVYACGRTEDAAEQLLAGAVLDAAVRQAQSAAADVVVGAEVLGGEPAQMLLGLDVDLVVLGHRGRGGFTSLLLGSVGQQVATHARVPVAVVRGRADAARGPIVAGVCGSATDETVLDAAFAAAARHACPLAVLRTYAPPTPLWVGDIPAPDDGVATLNGAARERLHQQLAPWRAAYPQVDAEAVVSPDDAGAVLVAVSHTARLLVVGRPSHSAVVNTLIGSTGLHLLHHAGCPVLVAPRAAVASVASANGRAQR